jgi:hypothetical protein
MTRWSLVVSDETDRALRTFLAQSGGKKGDISRFVETAVLDSLTKRSRLKQAVERIQERNAQYDQQEIMDTIDEAVAWARANRS